MSKLYKNMLNSLDCSKCGSRNICFLQQVSLSKYPEAVQEFVIKLPPRTFSYQEQDHRWHANYWAVQERLVQYYDIHNCELIGNKQLFLTNDRQREDDRQKIREYFKQMLDMAAKAIEKKNPEVSVVLDGVGLVLASDYIDAVSKIFSMLRTTIKNDNYFSGKCFGY